MIEDIKEVLISEQQINKRVSELGKQITQDYKGKDLVVVCLLKGAAIFTLDLVREIDLPVRIDYLVASSYGVDAQSSGYVKIVADLTSHLKNKHILICEDLIDTGLTLSYIQKYLALHEPASLEICSLLEKQDVARQALVDIKYVGFPCPNDFIVGYGLDYAHRYRNLPFIGALKEEVYK